jgi:hypothetical protein
MKKNTFNIKWIYITGVERWTSLITHFNAGGKISNALIYVWNVTDGKMFQDTNIYSVLNSNELLYQHHLC